MEVKSEADIVVYLQLDHDSARLIQHAIQAQKALARKDLRRGYEPDPERPNMKHKSLTVGQRIIDDIDAQIPRVKRTKGERKAWKALRPGRGTADDPG